MKNVIYMCYGSYGSEDCSICEVAEYCRAAKEQDERGALRGETHAEDADALDRLIEGCPVADFDIEVDNSTFSERTFSYDEVRSLLRFMTAMPAPVLKALHAIVDDTDLDRQHYVASIAHRLGISRQSLCQSLQRAFTKYPELARVFLYRSKKR
jgi:hypothetical protein